MASTLVPASIRGSRSVRAPRPSPADGSGRDPDARAHRGRDGDRPDIGPLGGGWLERPKVVQEGVDVVGQLLFGEGELADRYGDVTPLVVAELDLARLELADGGGDVGRDGPERGEGISPRGPSTRPSGPTTPIMSGVARATSKSIVPPLICCARSSAPTMSAPAARPSRRSRPGRRRPPARSCRSRAAGPPTRGRSDRSASGRFPGASRPRPSG